MSGDSWRIEQVPPLYLNFLTSADGQRAMLTDQSGALRSGDRHAISVDMQNDAKLLWQPVQSMLVGRVFGSDEPARLTTRISLRQSELSFINVPAILFAHSRLQQRTVIDIDTTSELLFWDVTAAGRLARGEAWQFASYANEFSLNVAGEPLLRERMILEKNELPKSTAGFAAAKLWLSAIAYGKKSVTRLRQKIQRLEALGLQTNYGYLSPVCLAAKGLDAAGTILTSRNFFNFQTAAA